MLMGIFYCEYDEVLMTDVICLRVRNVSSK